MLGALWRGKGGVTISGGSWRPDFGVARQVLRIGIPAAFEQVLATSAFLALALVVARLGTDVLAAQRITFNALSLSFLPGIGFGIAATALVGQSVGARRIAEGAAWLTARRPPRLMNTPPRRRGELEHDHFTMPSLSRSGGIDQAPVLAARTKRGLSAS